jgi:hypothetical protein
LTSVPGTAPQHPLERRARLSEGLDWFTAEGLHGDGVGGGVEHHLLVGAGERGEHDVFGGRVQGQDLVERLPRRPALDRPDRAADRDVDLQAAQCAPQPVASGRFDGHVEKLLSHG